MMDQCHNKYMNYMLMADMCKKMCDCYLAQAKYQFGMYMHQAKGTAMPEKPTYIMDGFMNPNMGMMPMMPNINMMGMGIDM